jgi:CRP/FNR family transcriptional regulator
MFRSLPPDDIAKLDREKTVKLYRSGQIIFSEGMPCWALCCIHSGAVKVYKHGERGEVQIIRLLGPASLLGLRPLVADEPFAATAEALGDTVACVFPRQTLHEVMHGSRALTQDMLAYLARELRHSEEMMMAMAQRSVKRRAAYLLLFLYGKDGPASTTGVHASAMLKKKEMAQMIGTSPETFSRTLRAFADRGLVALSHREIHLLDEPRLRSLATVGGTYT